MKGEGCIGEARQWAGDGEVDEITSKTQHPPVEKAKTNFNVFLLPRTHAVFRGKAGVGAWVLQHQPLILDRVTCIHVRTGRYKPRLQEGKLSNLLICI